MEPKIMPKGQKLDYNRQAKCLGITIDGKLKFEIHYKYLDISLQVLCIENVIQCRTLIAH